MVTRDGLVKVLDFGLGMLAPDAASVDPEATTTSVTRRS